VDFIFVSIELYFARCYGRSTTSEHWLEIGVFEGGWSVSAEFSRCWDVLANHLCTDIYIRECLTTLSLTVFTQKQTCSELSSSEVQFYTKNGSFPFLSLFGD